MDTVDLFLRVKKEDVVFVCSIIEECEGLATLRTPDPKREEKHTILKALVSPDFVEEFRGLLKALGEKTDIEEVAA